MGLGVLVYSNLFIHHASCIPSLLSTISIFLFFLNRRIFYLLVMPQWFLRVPNVHAKKRYEPAKIFFDISLDSTFLPFCCARSKFGADDPFHSGDIAAFVLEKLVRGKILPHTRSVTRRALTRPLKPLAHGCGTQLSLVETKKTGSTKVAVKLLASLGTLAPR